MSSDQGEPSGRGWPLYIGLILKDFRDSRIYVKTHGTFEKYCADRLQLTRARVDQLTRAATIAENIKTVGVAPTLESQVRPLRTLSPENQRKVWAVAVENNPHPSRAELELIIRVMGLKEGAQ
jgi:hypothetical protein